jgi:hypothetical protein
MRFRDEAAAHEEIAFISKELEKGAPEGQGRVAVPGLGDGAYDLPFLVKSADGNGSDVYSRYSFVRTGSIVGVTMLVDVRPVAPEAAVELLIALTGCFANGGCGDRIEMPASLFGGRTHGTESSTTGDSGRNVVRDEMLELAR